MAGFFDGVYLEDEGYTFKVELALNGFIIRVCGKTLIATNVEELQTYLKRFGKELDRAQKRRAARVCK